MSTPPHEIIVVPDVGQPSRDELRQQCYDVRIDVFVHEQKFSLDEEIDRCAPMTKQTRNNLANAHSRLSSLDPNATHFLLRLLPSLKPVGTIRCTKHNGYYKLSRLAVLKDYRQYRFGRELVQAFLDHVKRDAKRSGLPDPVTIKCHSQIPVKGFYAK